MKHAFAEEAEPPWTRPFCQAGVKAVGDSMVAKLKEATGMAGFEKLHGGVEVLLWWRRCARVNLEFLAWFLAG
jgi:hypothetical protein